MYTVYMQLCMYIHMHTFCTKHINQSGDLFDCMWGTQQGCFKLFRLKQAMCVKFG